MADRFYKMMRAGHGHPRPDMHFDPRRMGGNDGKLFL